ncbi:MAG: hypothetical protein ACLSB9_19500 [Hydrogeniiclostridium mannosilyticum]
MAVSGALILLLPLVGGADALWLAMPITELLVALAVIFLMVRYTKNLGVEKRLQENAPGCR